MIYEKDLYKIAKARLDNDEDVYDAVQETLIRAFKSIKKLKEVQYFKTWLIKILINKSNDIYNSKNKKKIIPFEHLESIKNFNSYNLDNIENLLDFKFICNNLKYEDKIIIILYYMENLSDKEIAELLNMNENTVKSKRRRAKNNIKDILEGGNING